MKKDDRERIILEKLYMKRKLELSDVMEMLEVSESTARRIFNSLEEGGKAIRTHGGISLLGDVLSDYSFDSLLSTRFDQKSVIGKAASAFIDRGDTLYIDCGTTVLALCLSLVRRLKAGELKDIRIFTNSLANVEVLAPVTPVTLVGGLYRPNRKDFAGYVSELVIGKLHFNKCFLGSDGVNVPNGFCATDFDTARLNQLAIANSDKTYILCDSTKFGKNSLIAFTEGGEADAVITDSEIRAEDEAAFTEAGLEVIKI